MGEGRASLRRTDADAFSYGPGEYEKYPFSTNVNSQQNR